MLSFNPYFIFTDYTKSEPRKMYFFFLNLQFLKFLSKKAKTELFLKNCSLLKRLFWKIFQINIVFIVQT